MPLRIILKRRVIVLPDLRVVNKIIEKTRDEFERGGLGQRGGWDSNASWSGYSIHRPLTRRMTP